MYGAIIGDIVGSVYEFDNIKTKDFPFFSKGCSYTDDSVMTVAVAKALMHACYAQTSFRKALIGTMQDYGRRYPYAGYGGMFACWLRVSDPQPYNSFGNGSAMRVSPCGLIAATLDEALALAEASADVTHNHPEGIKGAKATAAAMFLAKTGHSKEEIRAYTEEHFYVLDKTLDEIRPTYRFNETCQDTVPQAIIAFLESESYEDAIRCAISIGGDSDTLAAITGAIAWAFYAKNEVQTAAMADVKQQAQAMLPKEFVDVIRDFEKLCADRTDTHEHIVL